MAKTTKKTQQKRTAARGAKRPKGDGPAARGRKNATRANVGGDAAAQGDGKAAKKAGLAAWREDVARRLAAPDAEVDAAVAAAATARKTKKAKAGGKAKADRKPGCLDAAVEVLKAAKGGPLDAKTMVERMLAENLWQTTGKTPAATLYAAIIREISAKGAGARFRKDGPGRFALATKKEG